MLTTWDLANAHVEDLRGEAAHAQRVRLAHANDRAAVRRFLGRLSPATVQARYLAPLLPLDSGRADLEVTRLLDADTEKRTVVLAMDGPDVRGIGEFFVEDAESAEVGLVVEDQFQGRGLGKHLFRALQRLASDRGVQAFTGDMAYGNARMLSLLRGSGWSLQTQAGYGSLHFTLRLRS